MNSQHKQAKSQTSASTHPRGLKLEANSKEQQNRTADGLPTSDDWRELARLVQKEKDPQKMVELVQALIAQFDKDRSRIDLRDLKKENDSK
jgi:hypothetical protein